MEIVLQRELADWECTWESAWAAAVQRDYAEAGKAIGTATMHLYGHGEIVPKAGALLGYGGAYESSLRARWNY